MDKEAIARIIDPTAFDGDQVWTWPPVEPRRLAALAKATAILALQSSERGEGLAHIAERLCDNFDARVIADQVNAPLFADSEPHIQAYWLALSSTLSPAEPSPESREEALELLATATGDRDAWLKWYSQSQQVSASVLVETALSAIRALSAPAHD